MDHGLKTLERDCNLKICSFDTRYDIDPLFSKTTRKFDEMGLSTLLTSSLAIHPSLTLQFDSKAPINVEAEHGQVSLEVRGSNEMQNFSEKHKYVSDLIEQFMDQFR